MDNMLTIGSTLDKDTADNASAAIVSIIGAGYDARLSDEVLMKALDTLKNISEVKNVSITNCTFDNDQSKKVVVSEDYEVDQKVTGVKYSG